ncbi:MAG: hypothetical protein AB7V18_17815 [Pyrinomonadaceae bacterium]
MTPDFGSLYSFYGSRVADLPGFGTNWGSFTELALQLWDESMWNGWLTGHYVPNEQLGGTPGARLRIRTLTGGTDGGDYGEDGIPNTPDDNIYTEVEDTVYSWEETDESLSRCIYDLLINRFSDVNVHGATRNAVSSVWFSPGTSAAVRAYDWAAGFKTFAITIGTTVHYDTDTLPNLSKPTWDQFEIIIEEVAHVNQFLNMWASMPAKQTVPDPTHAGPETRPPNYSEAVTQWGLNYAAAVWNTPKGQDSYHDNAIEKPAKAEARSILQDIRSKSTDAYGPCGR